MTTSRKLPISREQAKERARALQAEAKASGHPLTYNRALMQVAGEFGYATLNEMVAQYRSTASAAKQDVVLSPVRSEPLYAFQFSALSDEVQDLVTRSISDMLFSRSILDVSGSMTPDQPPSVRAFDPKDSEAMFSAFLKVLHAPSGTSSDTDLDPVHSQQSGQVDPLWQGFQQDAAGTDHVAATKHFAEVLMSRVGERRASSDAGSRANMILFTDGEATPPLPPELYAFAQAEADILAEVPTEVMARIGVAWTIQTIGRNINLASRAEGAAAQLRSAGFAETAERLVDYFRQKTNPAS